MSEPEAIVSIEVLEEFPPALRRFRQFVAAHLQQVKADLREVRETLEEARSDTAREVRQLESEIASADDDDDTSGLERDLHESSDRLSRIGRALRNSGEFIASYEREAERLRSVMEDHVPRCEALLVRKADELRLMRAIQPENDLGWVGTALQNADFTEPGIHVAAGMLDLTANPLPSGYAWVKLSEMDLADALSDVQTPDDFRPYATYDMLRCGFDILRSTVLPAIAERGYTADSYFFERLDQSANRDPGQGARCVFDSFFGDGHLAVQRTPNGGPLTVINGRHRIKVAKDAGWTAVPVKITGGIPK